MIGSDDGAADGKRLTGAFSKVARASAVRVAVVGSLALPVAACGLESPPTTSEIFGEYVRSTEVVGDEFQSANSPDRMANFASLGSPQVLIGTLMAPRPCGKSSCALPWRQGGAKASPGPGLDAAQAFAGTNGKVYERKILVKRDNGKLELISLYLALKADGTNAIVDSKGEPHTGGLDGFRKNNDVFGSGDHMLVTRDITALSGKSEIVVLSAHTSPNRRPWLVGGALVLLAAVATWAILGRVLKSRA
ncbi:hypothetical protein [Actinomadura sp. 9N215]|uniref:hypothetical protein n=1 Tax=Actinomadura sp. 9N215 TaxID=3375150 RepID=UPI00379139E1